MYCNIMSTEKPGSSRSSDDGVTNKEVYNTYLMLVKQAKVDKKKFLSKIYVITSLKSLIVLQNLQPTLQQLFQGN